MSARLGKRPDYYKHPAYLKDSTIVIVIINSGLPQRPRKAKSHEPAYSQVLKHNKIDEQSVEIQRVTQEDSQTTIVDGVQS